MLQRPQPQSSEDHPYVDLLRLVLLPLLLKCLPVL